MANIGQFNKLKVVKEVPFGVYLDGGDLGEILLPKKVVPHNTSVDDEIDVFVYFDSEDKIIATTLKPRATLGHCAFLKVVDVNRVGAFLDWGLDKDLLVPKPEQHRPMEKNKFYIVYLKQDAEGRLLASSKLDYVLNNIPDNLSKGDEVNLLIAESSPLGKKVIINDSYWGLIHTTDLFKPIQYGQRMQGYVKTVREDGKIDIILRKPGQDSIHALAEQILSELRKQGGMLPLHDKSSSEEIKRMFGESKKSFKRAIGQLYKQGHIRIAIDGIYLRTND